MPTGVKVPHRIVGTIRIQVKPVAPVGVLLGKPAKDRVIEPGTEIILLGDGVDLLAVVGEAVGDGLLLDRDLSLGIVGIAVLDIAVFINDVGG